MTSLAGPDTSGGTSPSIPRSLKRRNPSRRKYGTTRRPPRPASPTFKREVAVLRFEGLSQARTAKLLGVSPDTIRRVERLPDVQQHIQELRHAWKQISLSRISGMAEDTWQMAQETVKNRDSKGFDNTMRGIAAMERISASVSGEGQRIEGSGTAETTPQGDLKALVTQLFGPPPSDPTSGGREER